MIRKTLRASLLATLFLATPALADEATVGRPIEGGSLHEGRLDMVAYYAGSAFQECVNKCPTMIVVPAGKFMMGSPDKERDWEATGRPQHEVLIAKPFAVSKFEVTYAEWDVCAAAAACPHVEDSWGRGQMPVTNVSWSDAKQYLGWLSRLTGKEYRLLTETEWEYVARAGSINRYAWGDDIGRGNANCDDCGSRWDLKQTSPVGSFKPNAFGLHDLYGNVWEWVEDRWHDGYDGAPMDGTAWVEGGDPNFRIIRGGSWRNEPELLRADARVKRSIGVRFDTLGFRVARTLSPFLSLLCEFAVTLTGVTGCPVQQIWARVSHSA